MELHFTWITNNFLFLSFYNLHMVTFSQSHFLSFFYYFSFAAMVGHLISSLSFDADLALHQMGLIESLTFLFGSRFKFFKFIANTSILSIVLTDEVHISSKLILQFDLKSDVQFLSLKWKATAIPTHNRYVISWSTSRLVLFGPKPIVLVLVFTNLVSAQFRLASILPS